MYECVVGTHHALEALGGRAGAASLLWVSAVGTLVTDVAPLAAIIVVCHVGSTMPQRERQRLCRNNGEGRRVPLTQLQNRRALQSAPESQHDSSGHAANVKTSRGLEPPAA